MLWLVSCTDYIKIKMDHLNELKTAVVAKTIQLEALIESGKPQSEIMAIYKELKELKFRIVQAEIAEKSSAEEPEAI